MSEDKENCSMRRAFEHFINFEPSDYAVPHFTPFEIRESRHFDRSETLEITIPKVSLQNFKNYNMLAWITL